MTILSIIFLFTVPAFFGTSVLAAFRLFNEKITLLLAGAISGLAVTIFAVYFTTPFVLLNAHTLLAVLLALVAATTWLLAKTSALAHWRRCRLDKSSLVVLAVLLVLSLLISPKLLVEKPDGSLHTGVVNAYGDIAWHVSNITSLQENRGFVPDNPILSGTPLAYPFLVNFFSAVLMAGGASLIQSVAWPTAVLFFITYSLLYVTALRFTRSRLAALIFLLLFLFSGSPVGWVRIVGDWQEHAGAVSSFILDLPRHYTGHSDNELRLHIINPVISMVLPQRSLLFGLPLAAVILLLVNEIRRRTVPALAVAGVLAGILPLFHAHTALALAPVIIGLIVLLPTKKWLYFFIPALLAGLPGIFIYQTGTDVFSSLLTLKPGWMSAPDNFLMYWLKNSGLLLPAALLGFYLPAPRVLKVLAAAGLVLFAAANIWLFAVWEWDNTKLFIYWLLFTLPLISYLLARWLLSPSLALRGATAAFIISHTLSGALDVWQLVPPDSQTWQVWSQSDAAFARKINAATEPGDVIATAPIHNSAAALTKRSQYLGYPGHVWTHGGSHWSREEGLEEFLAGEIQTLPEISPDYLLVGPAEKSHFTSLVINPRWPVAARQSGYTLYELPSD